MSKTSSIHPMIDGACDIADRKAKSVITMAGVIGEMMAEIHGGKWDVSVNHDACFVIISKDLSDQEGGKC